jgi:hypothetical protein
MTQNACYDGVTAPRWGKEEREYQIVRPKKAYVYGTGGGNCLVHRINYVKLCWWTTSPTGAHLVRLENPRMIAECFCGRTLFLDSTKAKMCEIPKPDAVLCAACHGEGRNFPKGKPHKVSRELAKIRIGCIEVP